MIAVETKYQAERIDDARWTLALQIRLARNVARSMHRHAVETETRDWQLAAAYRNEAVAHLETLAALRAVSRAMRGV